MLHEFYDEYECPFRQNQSGQMMPGYMQVPMQVPMQGQPMFQPYQGMPIMSGSMPAEAPGGTTAAPPFPTPQMLQGMEDASFEMAPGAPVQQDINYTQGFLRTQIGRRMLISFLIGTSTYQDRTGVLERVGISYIILREEEGTQLLCDIYSIKFVRIFGDRE